MENSKPILLVEDDKVDAMTVKRALKDLKVSNAVVHRLNGEEALNYLANDESPKPCIILLDLNMPKMNGIEFLRNAKSNESMKKIPVVVLTTSKQEQDIIESFSLSVAGYMVKSADYQEFVDVIRAIELYWTLSETPIENETKNEKFKTCTVS